jgi:hypothetical protein
VSTEFAEAEQRMVYRADGGCPAIGTYGIHSAAFLEGEGPCCWCGEHPVIDEPEDQS